MYIFRPEYFGGVLYDTETLRFKLVSDLPKNIDKLLPEPTKFRRKDILSAPVRVYFELTQRCNLACKHCFVSSSGSSPTGVATEELEYILDQLHRNRVIDVRFTGGEITTRPDWFEIIKYSKGKGFVVSLNTNGVYTNSQETVEQIAALNLDQVTVSIDGKQENHDFIRGKGSYIRTIESIKLMRDKDIKVRINSVITKKNLSDVPYIISFASEYAHEVNFFYMRPIGRAINYNHLSLDFLTHYYSAREAIALRDKYPGLSIMHFEQSLTERSIEENSSSGLEETLPYGNTTINIDCFGRLWPHGYNTYQDNRLFLGNLLFENLESIWEASPKLDGLRKWYRDILDRCKKCPEYRTRCAGFNFEMEIAKIKEGIENRFCINETPVPKLYEEYL